MSDGDELLREVAQRVVDGQDIDWDGVEAQLTTEEQRGTLKELRLLWDISNFHRHGVGPEDEGDPEEGPFAWGQLIVLQRLGKGSFGRVYRAFDTALNREVALKLFPVDPDAPPEAIEAILGEGKHLGRVRHSNVMHVYNAAYIDGRVGIWGEFVQGRNLAQLIDTIQTISAAETSVIGEVICRALTAVHRAGLLHRDIKAQNVMRESGGRIVLWTSASAARPTHRTPPNRGSNWRARRSTWRRSCSRVNPRRRRAISTASASCCSIW